ncbi:sensor histidine kinase [Adhaeribacter radiodurans]|uniref:histidine kinase n=1 Tax=Adhaeribacter radiodurans TaxID=2745197 RepID=A0A7L7LAH8_9BACT|nr:HAMP domain-containing sensor histidine kinase [Adhaeribacter radiodurans]QMU29555.1 HAMP domain-containing histidine kinase [Adhaeribacter radiodurans]
MSIRSRLTLTFTLLIAGILFVSFLIIYYSSEQYRKVEFYDRLHERGYIIAQLYLEQDEISNNSFEKIRRKFFQNLHQESIDIFDQDKKPRFIQDQYPFIAPLRAFDQIAKRKYIQFARGTRQGIGFLYQDNQGQFYIFVSAVDVTGHRKINNLRQVLIISFLAGSLVVFLIGRFFTFLVLNPVSEMVAEVNDIRITNLHRRLKEGNGQDEFGRLAKTFNQMLDRLETAFEMQQNFISNASHELRNPLTAISGEIEVTLSRERAPAEYKESLLTLQNEADRLEKLTKDLLNLAQTDYENSSQRSEKFLLDDLVLELKAEMDRLYPHNNIKVSFKNMPEQATVLEVTGNRDLLKAALLNVLENAHKFSNGKAVQLQLFYQNNLLHVQVQDQGIGIPPADLDKIFDPFYRAANARGIKGTGVGLALSQKIILRHHGQIQIASELNHGTLVQITLPAGS